MLTLSAFQQIASLLAIAAAVGGLAILLRQPLIVAFIFVGILVGPAGLGIIEIGHELELFATIGISILLFLVGLRLDVAIIRSTGPVALATGLGQVFFTSVVGYLICIALGLRPVHALYVAVALTFSSTIIIVKLLSDKREIDALHGRIAVGFLIVQDIVVVLVMIALSAFGSEAAANEDPTHPIVQGMYVLLRGLAFLAAIALLMRFVLPRVVHRLARSQELLILFAISWAVALAALGDMLGFSKEVGAFLAGVSLASTGYRDAIGGRLVSLRDFLLLFFFINLGVNLELRTMGEQVGAAVILSLFVLIGNPLIVIIIMGFMGYRKRTGFLAGLTVAQISEFSLILAALGLSLGHIDADTLGLVTLVGLITIGLSTYMILYSHPIYERIAPLLSAFERRVPHRESANDDDRCPADVDVILFGLGRYGGRIADELERHELRLFGVDFDPQVVAQWKRGGRAAQYGDAEDPEMPAVLPLLSARCVVSSMPQLHANRALMRALRDYGYTGRFVAAAHSRHDAESLEREGASLVLLPFADAAERAGERIRSCLGE